MREDRCPRCGGQLSVIRNVRGYELWRVKEIADGKVWVDSGESLEENTETVGMATVNCRNSCGWYEDYEAKNVEW